MVILSDTEQGDAVMPGGREVIGAGPLVEGGGGCRLPKEAPSIRFHCSAEETTH